MILLNEITTITIQISQFIHLQLYLSETTSGNSSIGLIVTNWSKKSWNIYCKLWKGIHYLCNICSRKGTDVLKGTEAGVFKTVYGSIALIVVDL